MLQNGHILNSYIIWIRKTSQTFRFKWNFHCFKANRKTNGFLLASECFLKKHNALLTQSGISVDKNDTALFINKVLIWWNILNVKSLRIDKLHNDLLQAEIRSPNDTRLDFIIEFSKMALNMAGSQGNRKKQLSQNIATAIHHTCNGIVSLCWHL